MTNDQHHPPAEPDLAPLPHRPGWPKAIGIISIVLGALALTCMILSGAMVPLGAAMAGEAFEDIPPPPNMRLSPPLLGALGLGALVNLVLLIAGIMTLRRSTLGRSLHLAYGVLGVIAALVGVAIQLHMQNELQQWIADYGDTEIPGGGGTTWGEQMQMQQQFQGISMIAGLIISLAYPVFCIIWFGMIKRNAEAMGAGLPEDDAGL